MTQDRTGEDMLDELYSERIGKGVNLSDTASRLLAVLGKLEVHFRQVNEDTWVFHKYLIDGKVVGKGVVDELEYYGFLSPMPMVMKRDRECRECGLNKRGKEYRDEQTRVPNAAD